MAAKLEKDTSGVKDTKSTEGTLIRNSGEMGSNGVSAAMESLTTSESVASPMEAEDSSSALITVMDSSGTTGGKKKLSPLMQTQIKQIKPLLSASSRLGRALAELFGLLVKLSVGSPVRQRRTQQVVPTPTTPSQAARKVATALTDLLASGLSWTPPPCSPVPKLRSVCTSLNKIDAYNSEVTI